MPDGGKHSRFAANVADLPSASDSHDLKGCQYRSSVAKPLAALLACPSDSLRLGTRHDPKTATKGHAASQPLDVLVEGVMGVMFAAVCARKRNIRA